MLDQNTDRMWYVIGAVIVGAALIFLMNGAFPTLFANVGETFEEKVEQTTEMTDGIRPVPMSPNKNLLDYSGQGYLNPNMAYYFYKPNVVMEDGKEALAFSHNADITFLGEDTYRIEAGQEYTFSYYAKGSVNMLVDSVYITASNQNFLKNHYVTTEWQHYSFTFVGKGNERVRVHTYPDIYNNQTGEYSTYYITDWKLEKGSVATPWVPKR